MRLGWFCRLMVWGALLAVLWTLPAAASDGVQGWSIEHTVNPARYNGLGAVSCPAVSMCMAVGTDSPPDALVAERWNGRKWRVQTPSGPNPSSHLPSTLLAVSCPSTRVCQAVGIFDYSRSMTLAERWSGTGWRIERTPSPADSALESVSCVSASACVAVGSSSDGTEALVERWNGRRWKVQAAPSPSNTKLLGVSCISGSSCTAVGSYDDYAKILIEHWNGQRWAIQPSPNPPAVGDNYKSPKTSELSAVSCFSAASCTAVGFYTPALYTTTPLIERWNGRRWKLQASGGGGALNAVSCPSARTCTAVGVLNTNGDGETAERWNGRKWQTQRTPNPTPKTYNSTRLSGVSCPQTTTCTAVGWYAANLAESQKTLADRWNR